MAQTMRIVGRRSPPPAGELPDERAREAMTQMAQYRTRAPKGVFHYKCHDDANRDRDRWQIEAIVAKQNNR
jgi:hypothetical protein